MGVNVCAVSTQPRFIADRGGSTGLVAQIHPLKNKTKLISHPVSGGEIHPPQSISVVKPETGI